LGGNNNGSSGGLFYTPDNTYLYLGSKANSTVTESSSDIIIEADEFAWGNSWPQIGTSGHVTVQSYSPSFATQYSMRMGWNKNNQTMSGLTIGQTTNTEDILVGYDLAVAGPVSIYGGSIDIDSDIIATGGNILLDADLDSGIASGSDGINVADATVIKTINSGDITLKGRSGTGNIAGLIGVESIGLNTEIDSAGDIYISGISESSNSSTTRGIWLKGTLKAVGNINLEGQAKSSGNDYDVSIQDISITSGGNLLMDAQNGGRIRMAGSNVIASDGNQTYYTNNFDPSSGNQFNGTGILSIYPDRDSDSFSISPSLSSLVIDPNLTGITLGSTTNTSDITLSDAITVSGPVSVYGGHITINENIDTTGGSASGDILLRGTGNITFADGKNLTTNGGDVTLWADSDASGTTSTAGGTIALLNGSSINTSGGNITLAGGADTNTDGIPDGYAIGAYSMQARGATNATAGLSLDNATIDAGAGNVILRGQGIGDRQNFQIGTRLYGGSITAKDVTVSAIGSTRGPSSSSWGLSLEGFSILGSGDISLNGIGGKAGTSNSDANQAGVEIRPALDNSTKHSQVKATGNGTILIKGTGGSGALSTANNLNAAGIRIISGQTNPINSENGSVTLEGTSGYNGGGPGILVESPVSSTNGAITLKALQSTAGTTGLNGNIEIKSTVTTNANLIIESLGAVTQTAAITADGLALKGLGFGYFRQCIK
jgi:hypothetical protein